MSASAIGQRASYKGEMPLFAAQKPRIRHHVEYLVSVATAAGVLNTIPEDRSHQHAITQMHSLLPDHNIKRLAR